MLKLSIGVRQVPNGGWWAYVEGLPNCDAPGQTPEEAISNLVDTMKGYFSALVKNAAKDLQEQTKAGKRDFEIELIYLPTWKKVAGRFVLQELRCHPLPWKMEQDDWTFEVDASDGHIVATRMTHREAESIIKLAEEISANLRFNEDLIKGERDH